MTLRIITRTRGSGAAPWIHSALESIRLYSPVGATSVIVECVDAAAAFRQAWEQVRKSEFVAFVDDDDLVINDSLNKCLDVMLSTEDCGLVFTDDQRIDEQGKPCDRSVPRRRVTYQDIMNGPRAAHHVAVIRTSAVPATLWEDCTSKGCIDWMIKASAALSQGAIYLPIFGYQWRQHGGAMHLQIQVTEMQAHQEVLLKHCKVNLRSEVPKQ